ncbi:MAG: ApaG domain [Sandaracinaceae bacterium]|nr:ApaG domain [Sandaracinaceae bacterium]
MEFACWWRAASSKSSLSPPPSSHLRFAYRVRIENVGGEVVRLRATNKGHHRQLSTWKRCGAQGIIRRAAHAAPRPGVQYTSGAILRTQRGGMKGSYQMVTEGGEQFDAVIAEFALERPYSLNWRTLLWDPHAVGWNGCIVDEEHELAFAGTQREARAVVT